ncbi:MAG: hypothetical protein AAF518_23795 [Spirochaetota bacterium]
MDHEHKIRNWIQYKLHFYSEQKKYDDRLMECNLIRAFSDLRAKELKKLKLSDTFDRTLVNGLEKTHCEGESLLSKFRSLVWKRRGPSFILIPSLSVIAVLVLHRTITTDPSITQPPTVRTSLSSGFVKKVSNIPIHIMKENNVKEKYLLNVLEKNPDDMQTLKQLQVYYNGMGNHKMASSIQYKLQMISK